MSDSPEKDPVIYRVPPWMLLSTIFLTGNIIMMLEVVGTRVVGPYFGVGIYVWSALITVALLALAAGYWIGGKVADKYKKPEYLYAGILFAGLLTFLIPVLRNPLLSMAGGIGMRPGVILGSSILFGPPLFILGMVSPYATKLYTDQFEKLGSKVGLLYAVSTFGSFVGTITMGFYLIPNFSLTLIIVSLGTGLVLIPMVYFFLVRTKKLWALASFILLGLASMFFFPLDQADGWTSGNIKILHKTTSFYGEIKVVQIAKHRMLLVDGVTQSGEDMSTLKATPQYVLDMKAAVERYAPKAKDALLLGLGGGNMVHLLLDQGLTLDVVEIDKKIKEVAIEYFQVDPEKANIILEDGRRFIKQSTKKYDVIVLNTFSGESFPSHMLTKEFFLEVKERLNPNGVILLNFVGYVQGKHRKASASVKATVRAAYKWCHSYFRQPKTKFANIVFVAGDDPVAEVSAENQTWASMDDHEVEISGWEEAVVCTDEYNPVEFMNRVVYRRWRELVMESLGPEILLH